MSIEAVIAGGACHGANLHNPDSWHPHRAVLARPGASREFVAFATGAASGRRPALTFEQAILPHLDAARGVACAITRDPVIADDIVQDACLRAMRYFKSFRGDNARAWLLQIVRNTAYAGMPRTRFQSLSDVDHDGETRTLEIASVDAEPEAAIAADQLRVEVRKAVAELPAHLRECLLLREMDELPYRQIAQIVGVPIGTVMSRLFRARRMLMTPQTASLR